MREPKSSGLDDEERYDFVPVAYLTLDLGGRVREANLTAAALLDVRRDLLVGQLFADLVIPNDQRTFDDHLRRCFEGGGKTTSDLTVLVATGPTVTVQMASAPILDAAGTVVGAQIALADMSVRKLVEDKLRVLADVSRVLGSSFDYAATLSGVAQLVVPVLADVCAIDVVESSGTLRRIALACADSADEALLASIWEGARASDGDGVIARALTSRQPIVLAPVHGAATVLVPMVVRDQTLGIITMMATRSGRQFGPSELVTGEDLAARTAIAVEHAQLYEEAQRAIRGRQDLLSFVSHDLKNPLMALSLTTELLLRGRPPEGGGERRRGWRQLERIRQGIAQMGRMIEDLLDLASADAGRLSMSIVDDDLIPMLREAIDMLKPVAEEKGINLAFDDGGLAALAVHCDRARVLQVLSNILGNAIKFTPEVGTVTVRVAAQALQAQVIVEDNGAGLSPDVQSHVFERFWQADPSSHTGRGLGLYISKQIIETQGGAIWAESQPPGGSTFGFTLPRTPATGRGS
jgi:PAS domain S-box-containing protein